MTRKNYTSPRTEVVSVQTHTQILAGSGLPISDGKDQIEAW